MKLVILIVCLVIIILIIASGTFAVLPLSSDDNITDDIITDDIIADDDATSGKSSDIFVTLPSNIIVKGSRLGKYCAESNKGIICNTDVPGPRARFTLIKLRDGRYGIIVERTKKYCTDNPGKCDRDVRNWEHFKIEKLPNGKISIISSRNNKYCTDVGTGVVCNKDTVGDLESFEYTLS